MPDITRRDFLAGASALAGAALLGRQVFAAEVQPAVKPVRVKSGTDIVTLGNTGIKTSVLGIGTGSFGGREQRNLGQDGFVRLVREAFDRGIRYIDTADSYKMHAFVGAAIKELKREELFIQTKTFSRTADRVKDDIERYRRELGIETLDTLLIHCMTKSGWPKDLRPVIDVMLEAKRKGHVRAIGVSCHDFGALVDSVGCQEMEVHLVRINPFRSHMEGSPEDVSAQMKRMFEKGRGVIGMKIYGEGAFKTREQRYESLKYVLGLGTVHCFTIGFSSAAQIDETLELIREAVAA